MIFGNGILQLIAAKNLPGYDDFIDASFTKDFNHEEELEIFYPPDHLSAGTKYSFRGINEDNTVLGNFLAEGKRTEKQEDGLLSFLKDFIYPYQSEITFRANSANITPFPINDENNDADDFILDGSIIRGTQSGAKRFYNGPFKGYTKEIQEVCESYDELSLKDKSDCDGWRKGSFYEPSYLPILHDVFQYVGEPRQRADILKPFNQSFMRDNPFGFVYYNWLNVLDRKNRPIPYNTDSEYGNYCVLISPRHAVVFSQTDVSPSNIVFYSETEGCVTPTVQTIVSSFKEIWDAIGFVNENRDSETLLAFNEMAKNFEGIKILTFSENLPSDIYPVILYDPHKSDSVFHSMMFGQEGRGHVCMICPPITADEIGTYNIRFESSGECPEIPQIQDENDCGCLGNRNIKINFPLPSTTSILGSFGLDGGDIGSPLITYRGNLPIFLGFISKQDIVDGKPITKADILGIGSTKQYDFPWGSSFSPFDILNLYLKLTNQSGLNTRIIRYPTDTSFSYPFPDGIPTKNEVAGIDSYQVPNEEQLRECEYAIVMKVVDCIRRAASAIECECDTYVKEENWLLAYFCINKACDVLRKYMRNSDFFIPFSCPPLCSRNRGFNPRNILNMLLGALAAKIGEDPCLALQLIQNGFLDICNKDANDALNNRPCLDSKGNPTVPTTPITPPDLSSECLERMRMLCRLRPDVLHNPDEWLGRGFACVLAEIFSDGYDQLSQQEKDQRAINCFLRFCPSGGIDLGPQCTGRVSCLDYIRAWLFGIERFPIPNCRIPPLSPYPPGSLTGPGTACSDPRY
jgi:hypothetical protein